MERHERLVTISIVMPANMARYIRVLAAQQDKSRSQFVREALEETLPPERNTQALAAGEVAS